MQKKIYRSPCPSCGRGFLVWCEDGTIRCPVCGLSLPKDNNFESCFPKPLLKGR